MNTYKQNLSNQLNGTSVKLLDQNGFYNNTPSKSKHFVKLIKHANWLNGKATKKRTINSLIDTFSNKVQTK